MLDSSHTGSIILAWTETGRLSMMQQGQPLNAASMPYGPSEGQEDGDAREPQLSQSRDASRQRECTSGSGSVSASVKTRRRNRASGAAQRRKARLLAGDLPGSPARRHALADNVASMKAKRGVAWTRYILGMAARGDIRCHTCGRRPRNCRCCHTRSHKKG